MIVARAEAAQDHAPFVRPVITVAILQKQQLGPLADVGAAISQFDAGGNHQAVSEDDRFVAAPVAVRVFENENSVVRRLAGFNLRIHRAADDP